MSQISLKVRNAVKAKLADAGTGLNANLTAAVAGGGYVTAPTPTFDFSPTSKQFYSARLGPDDIDATTPSIYPMVFLYSMTSENQNIQKFSLFSGRVVVGMDIHVTWRQAKATPDFNDTGDLIEDAVIKTFNDDSFGLFTPTAVSYDGEIAMERGPLQMAGENWRQMLRFRLAFEVNTN